MSTVRAASALPGLFALFGLLGAAGCSILFDPSAGGAGGGGDGGADGGAEKRDSGTVSGGQPPVRVTSDGASSQAPSLVVSPGGFAVVWQDERVGQDEIFAALLSPDGQKLGGDVQVSDQPGASEAPVVTATEQGFAVAWQDRAAGNYEIYLARLKSDGSREGEEFRVSNNALYDSLNPSMVQTDAGLAIGFSDLRTGNLELFCSLVYPDNELEAPVQITEQSAPSRNPSIAWTGSELGAVWEDERSGGLETLYFFQMAGDCTRGAGTASAVYEEDAVAQTDPQLLWLGDSYALAWQADTDGNGNPEIYLARFGQDGSVSSGPVRVNQSTASAVAPSIAWSGTEILVVWQDRRDGNDEIYLARADDDLAIEERRITADAAASASPSLVFGHGRYGIAWRDARDGNEEIYFALIDPSD